MTGDRAPRSASRRTENGSDRYLSSNVHGGVTRNNRRRADATRVSVRGRWTHAAGPPTWGASLGREEPTRPIVDRPPRNARRSAGDADPRGRGAGVRLRSQTGSG